MPTFQMFFILGIAVEPSPCTGGRHVSNEPSETTEKAPLRSTVSSGREKMSDSKSRSPTLATYACSPLAIPAKHACFVHKSRPKYELSLKMAAFGEKLGQ